MASNAAVSLASRRFSSARTHIGKPEDATNASRMPACFEISSGSRRASALPSAAPAGDRIGSEPCAQ